MSEAVNTVKDVLQKGGNLRLPAILRLLTNSALDDEEKAGEDEVKFLSKSGGRPKKRPKAKESEASAQGDWSTLEGALTTLPPKLPSGGSTLAAENETWHEIPVARMTPELEKDLRVIENRQHLDPKRFYKATGSGRRKGELPSRVQVGTVVAGAHEFYSARLTKRERRGSIMDEVMSDERIVAYTKNKFKGLQAAKQGNRRVIDPASKRKRKRSSDDF